MKITLNNFQKYFHTKKSISEIKNDLSYNKKEGYLFFIEQVEKLATDIPFEVFYFLCPSSTSSFNAFPIPIEDFRLWKNKKEHFRFMNLYFKEYYIKRMEDVNHLFQYDYENPFIGRHFVWYFKIKKTDRNHIS